jgi:cellulose synthase/poly-beta-1,6-N-acetylglucosamine synthase-like glycosyltransferase
LILIILLSVIVFTFAVRSLFFLFIIMIDRENSLIMHKQQKNNKFIYSKENIGSNYSNFFISILIASYNENIVIERLLSSLSKLSYNYDKFETIIIDDSDDETINIIKKWQKTLPNLKVIHRQNREGWKGAALNLGLNNLNENSQIVLIVDADNILEEDTLEKIARFFLEFKEKKYSSFVIQGYPKSLNMYEDNKTSFSIIEESNKNRTDLDNTIHTKDNWISRGISFRLYQRNKPFCYKY